MLDVQRLRAIVVPCIKTALQVNLAKAKGGWRPLTMLESLEEEFKAIEGPTTQRCSLARSLLPAGEVYSRHNLAYERRQPAAADVLYLDALVVEDARSSGRPLARLPADYEKFLNAINLCQADAVMQARGVCDEARRLYQEAFQGLRIHVDTAWGPSEEVRCDRGAGMRMEPNEVSCLGGVVLRALEFLAGYGLFITASMDRTVGRILDSVYSLQGTVPANMVGLFDARKFNASAKFCRVGKLAYAVRFRVDELRRDEVPCNTWHSQALWEGLSEGAGVSAHTCAAAAGMATDRALSDERLGSGMRLDAGSTKGDPRGLGQSNLGIP
eukprot:s1457_g27.t1